MTEPLRVAIVGYGIAGIATAVHLRRQGHSITHFDRNDPPSALGAGMLLHPPAQRELEALGILEAALACGAPVRGIYAQTTDGHPLFDFDYAGLAARQFGLGIQRGALHRLLSGADTGRELVMAGCSITGVESLGGYLLQDSGVRHGPFDLIVVADGAESKLRGNALFSTRRNQRAETAALVGLLDDHEGLAPDRLVQRFNRGVHVSVWPVGSDSPGGVPRCSFAMNIASADHGKVRESDQWKKCISGFYPELGSALKEQGANSFTYVFTYRDIEVEDYSNGRVVLIGDAAHSMSPQLGVGAQLAMADARILADKIARNHSVALALQDYSRTRPAQIRRYQQASRWLTPLLQSDSLFLAGLRDRILAPAMRSPLARQMAQELLC